MAVNGQRLFWISIIIVELVLVYIAWLPARNRFRRPARRPALASRVGRQPESKASLVQVAPAKPLAARSGVPARKKQLIVNASLKAPEPIAAKPAPTPKSATTAAESFWCHLSMVESRCDCNATNDQRASNLVIP
jgi:hypothetical protein